jgi:hypothetical protein
LKLITAHRILIGAGIAFFVFYAIVSLLHGRPGAPVQATVSLAIAIGLVIYYRSLRSKWRNPPS